MLVEAGTGRATPVVSGGLATVPGRVLARGDIGGGPIATSWSSLVVAARSSALRRVCARGVPGLVASSEGLAVGSGVALLPAPSTNRFSRGVTAGGGWSWATRSGPPICWRAASAASRALASTAIRAAGSLAEGFLWGGGRPPARGVRPGGACALGAATLRSGSLRSAVVVGSLGLGSLGHERPPSVDREDPALDWDGMEGLQVSVEVRVPSPRLSFRSSFRRDLGSRSAIVLDAAATAWPSGARSTAPSGRWHPTVVQWTPHSPFSSIDTFLLYPWHGFRHIQ